MDYSGKIITKNAVTPTQTAASGVWTLDDALQAQKGNNWPIPGVPNPISKSLRFNSADSAYLNRTPTTSLNPQKFTFSFWIKLCSLSTNVVGLWGSRGSPVVTRAEFGFYLNKFYFQNNNGSTWNVDLSTVAVFRDPSAWYHIVIAVDTTQATASNRVRVYFNGVEQTLTGTTPTQNLNLEVLTTTSSSFIGTDLNTTGRFFDGYMTEYNLIDGQQLTPSDFGMTDTNTGVWIPKKYTGTYGTNGFYLNFKDATNTSTLGLDYSGNGNNWNANNFSVTAGAGNDSLTDVPTPWVGYSVNGDTGGVVRGNYCTLNPLKSKPTLSNGNLYAEFPTTTWYTATSTIAISSGKWYWEVTWGSINNSSTYGMTGIVPVTFNEAIGNYPGYDVASFGYFSIGQKYNNGTPGVYGTSYTNDTIGVALDMDAGTIVFYKNGVSQGTAYTGLAPATFTPAIATYGTNATVNFGQRPFAYTPPAGFKSLCTTNLPTPTIGATSSTTADKYFNTVLRNGFGTSGGTVTTGFYPDFVWQKQRNGLSDHYLVNTIAGGTKTLSSNTTAAEATDANWITAFSSTGFTQGSSDFGNSSTTIAVWAWNANSGSTVSNTAGSITSTVSANTTAGFSIVTYTGNGTNGATVGHGLGVSPGFVIVKRRNAAGDNWPIWHTSLGNNAGAYLNTTTASYSSSTHVQSVTSTTFAIGVDTDVNQNGGTYVSYVFAPVAGYSAFGSYAGNNSADGPFIYTGFRPAFVLIKGTSAGYIWTIEDNKRNTYNPETLYLQPQSSGAEGTFTTQDFTSNGFKIRTTDTAWNGNGITYIYAAFAESPFKFSNAR